MVYNDSQSGEYNVEEKERTGIHMHVLLRFIRNTV